MNIVPIKRERTPLFQRRPLKQALRNLRTEENETCTFLLIAPPFQGVLLSVDVYSPLLRLDQIVNVVPRFMFSQLQ